MCVVCVHIHMHNQYLYAYTPVGRVHMHMCVYPCAASMFVKIWHWAGVSFYIAFILMYWVRVSHLPPVLTTLASLGRRIAPWFPWVCLFSGIRGGWSIRLNFPMHVNLKSNLHALTGGTSATDPSSQPSQGVYKINKLVYDTPLDNKL